MNYGCVVIYQEILSICTDVVNEYL